MDIDRNRLRTGLPQVGVQPYRQVHAHSTGNRNSTVQNEADYHYRKDPELGFFSHVVGNGRVMQVGPVNNGSWDVGGGWNTESYAAVELIESHSTKEEFMADYRLYIELLRNLADEAGLPKTLDTDDLAGIKTHEYCTNNQPNNHSDHVDPYPYLASWGISREQFKQDIENGLRAATGWQKMALATGTYTQTALIQKISLRKSTVPGIISMAQAICFQTAGRSTQTVIGTTLTNQAKWLQAGRKSLRSGTILM
ncbi:lytic amidase [Streptococcus pneumoniae GA11426]|nr:lytic amidase [Streptococcus pneumoniae GA11426]